MAERVVWRPAWYVWIVVGLAALGLLRYREPQLVHGYGLILALCFVPVGVLIARRVWELSPAVIMCGAIVCSIFSGSWEHLGLHGIPLDRVLDIVVLLMVFLRAPGVSRMPRLQMRNVHLLMLVTIVYVLLSALAAGTLTSEAGLLGLLDQVGVTPYLMFLLAPSIFAGRRERNFLLVTLVGLGAYLGVTAIFESLGPHSLVFPSYIVHVDAALPEARAGGPFQSSVAEGCATFACAVAAVIAFVQWDGRRSRWFAGFTAIVSIFGCFLTLERGVWIAAVVAAVVTALCTRQGRRWLAPAALICALLVGGPLVLSSSLSSKVSTRVNYKVSVWDRENQTAAGLRMVEVKPLLGFGWRQFPTDGLAYFRQSNSYPMTGYSTPERLEPLHDSYLSYAVELGLIGALLWLVTFLWGIGGAIFAPTYPDMRRWKLGLLSIAVFFLVVSLFNPYMASFPSLLVWVWAGVSMSGVPAVSWQERTRSPAPAVRPIAWTLA
jgi:putative inorganic carbon (HCO3(-)) transporter